MEENLLSYFNKSKYLSIKYKNYFPIYENIFKEYKNKKIIFVEIGVFSGGSLFMWREFFGKEARIIGVDLNEDALRFKNNLPSTTRQAVGSTSNFLFSATPMAQ